MFKTLSNGLHLKISARIQRIFLGSACITFLKILSGFALLSLLSSGSDGTLTYYGILQNCLTILVAIIGMSVQNGITTHTAKADIENSRSDIGSHLASVLLIGSSIAGLLAVVFMLVGFELGELLGFANDRYFPLLSLVCITFLAVMHRYYASFLFGKGFVLRGQSLDLLRNIVVLVAALFWINGNNSYDLIWILAFGNLVVVPFILRIAIKNPLNNIKIRLKLNAATFQIVKAGLITGYSGILFALVSLLIRGHAVEVGGYNLSDSWELLLRFIVMYQLLVTAPLSQILLRSYATSSLDKPLNFFLKALPISILILVLLSAIPETLMIKALAVLFDQEIAHLKLILFLLIGSELLRTLGTVCHNMLVSRALILPQAIFETCSQAIVLFMVFYFASNNFLLLYFSGLFVSMFFWMTMNLLYIKYLNRL
jgi:hypothetical protein